MTSDQAVGVLSLCLALAGTETLHGIARTVLLVPRVGKARALQLGIVSGSLLAFGVCLLLVPRVGLHGLGPHLALGAGLAAFMAAFDVAIGRLVMRLRWARIWRDFDPAGGNLLSLGLVLLAGMPALVWWLQAPR